MVLNTHVALGYTNDRFENVDSNYIKQDLPSYGIDNVSYTNNSPITGYFAPFVHVLREDPTPTDTDNSSSSGVFFIDYGTTPDATDLTPLDIAVMEDPDGA